MPRRCLPVLSALFLVLPAACETATLPAAAPTAPVELSIHAVQRCPHCGWIESKRKILSSVAAPGGIYEYTLRMPDGSSRVFQEALPATWRLGERLAVIDGTRPPRD